MRYKAVTHPVLASSNSHYEKSTGIWMVKKLKTFEHERK